MEELGLKNDNLGKEQYNEFLNEKDKLIYNSVILNNDDIEVK